MKLITNKLPSIEPYIAPKEMAWAIRHQQKAGACLTFSEGLVYIEILAKHTEDLMYYLLIVERQRIK